MIFDRCKRGSWLWIAPGCFAGRLFSCHDIEISGLPFPFTPGASLCRLKKVGADILRRNVIDWRVTCLKHAPGAPGISDKFIVEINADMLVYLFKFGRSWIIPDRFLARTGFDSLQLIVKLPFLDRLILAGKSLCRQCRIRASLPFSVGANDHQNSRNNGRDPGSV